MIKTGDRVYISGGYDYDVNWLNGNEGYQATAVKFIPGQNDTDGLLVEFDEEIVTKDSHKGKYAVLELRHENTSWVSDQSVHIELCDFLPEEKPWDERKKGVWVEAAANIRLV